jgi:TolA-binding protein
LADAQDLLQQAEDYEKEGHFEQAEATYKEIVAEYGGTDEALRGQEKLTILYIRCSKPAEADSAFQDLVTGFSQNDHVADAVDHIADAYRELGQFEKARVRYRHAAQQWPSAEHAAEAQAGVARCSILLGDEDAAQAATDKLLADFGASPHIAKAVDNVADEYRKLSKYGQARDIYRTIVERWSGAEHAIEAQKGVVLCSIALADDPNAQVAMNELWSDFSGHADLAAVLYDIADGYQKARRFDKAKDIYQDVAEQCPNSRYAPKAPLDIRKADILALADSGQDGAVDGAIDSLAADFAGNEYLPTVVYKIAVQYHVKAYRRINEGQTNESPHAFQRAAEIFERVTNDFAGSDPVAKACRSAGDCYRKTGDYQTSITWYQRVVDDYPSFRGAGNALFMVGRNYEELGKSGVIAKPQADAKIRAAYERLLDRYPGCQGARYARLWLSGHEN